MKYLVCVYTSGKPRYADARRRLSEEPWFRALASDPQVRVIDVRADGSLDAPSFDGSTLSVPVPDEYDRLAEKTFRTIAYASEHFSFDYLIKLDDTIVDSDFNARFRERSPKSLCAGDYGGLILSLTNAFLFRRWAAQHGVATRSLPRTAPYFIGKCYACSFAACRSIAAHGAAYLPEFLRAGGVEDVFVGTVLFNRHFGPARRAALFLRACVRMVGVFALVPLKRLGLFRSVPQR